MRRAVVGRTRVSIPVIGQGTWNLEASDRARAIATLRRGLELGMTHVDTAEMYGSGGVEELVGEVIAGRRDEVYLASKVLPRNASRAGTVRACERSLKRLGTDRLDLYLLHWPGPHPLEETIAAFEELHAAGKIRAYGVSNFDAPSLERAIAIAGEGRIACNQVPYHLDDREIEGAVLPLCEARGVALVGYSPFGSGQFPEGERARVLDEIARRHRATARQVALAFLTRKPALFAIPKASSIAHVEENAKAGELQLTAADVKRIDAAFG